MIVFLLKIKNSSATLISATTNLLTIVFLLVKNDLCAQLEFKNEIPWKFCF